MVSIVHQTNWDFVKGVNTFPYTVTIPAATAGNKLIFLSGGGAITTPTGFTRRDSYGGGAQDVSIWEYTCVGGETSVVFNLNGAGCDVSGCIFEVGSGLTFVGFSNNGSGSNTSQAVDYQFLPGSAVTASGAGVIFSIATVTTSSAYSTANRLRSHGPYGKIYREGGNQTGTCTNFIYQIAIADVDATHSYPASLSAGQYKSTTQWLASGTCFVTQVLFSDSSGIATNPAAANYIVKENSLPGTDYGNHFLGNLGTSSHISGYCDKVSYAPGDTVNFKVYSEHTGGGSTDTARVEIYRRGYYGRETFGARSPLGNGDGYLTVTPTVQSTPTVDSTTGATSCAWTTNATWTIPSGTPSGLYTVIFRRTDITAFASGHFIIRDSSVSGKPVVVIPDATHQAYNPWGGVGDHGDYSTGTWSGMDVYQAGSDDASPNFAHRSYACSFDRPYGTQSVKDMTYINDVTTGQICWFEAQGYPVVYISDMDLEGSPHYLDSASHVIISGHPEYISTDMYNAYTNARNNGAQIICLGSNVALWRVRFDSTDTNHRTMICYKDSGTLDITAGFTGSGRDPGDSNSTPEWTGTWRDSRTLAGTGNLDVRRENSLFGQIFTVSGPLQQQAVVSQSYQTLPCFRNSSSIQALTSGGTFTTSVNCVGYEAESRDGSVGEPTNIVDIWAHTYTGITGIANDAGSTYNGSGSVKIGWSLYRYDAAEASGILAPLNFHGGSWRCSGPLTRWQFGVAPSGPSVDLDWQNAFLCLFYDLGLHPVTLTSIRPGEDSDVSDPSVGAPGPARADIARAYGLTIPDQTVSVDSVVSSERFGNPTISTGNSTVPVDGLRSSEVLGNIALTTSVSPDVQGVPSAEALGSVTCTGIYTAASQGISSGETFGSQSISSYATISPAGIDASTPPSTIQAIPNVTDAGTSSAEQVGNASVAGLNTVQPAGINSLEAFGSHSVQALATVAPAGIDTTEALGTITCTTTITVSVEGHASSETYGVSNIAGLNTVTAEAVPSTEIIGTTSLSASNTVVPFGITDEQIGNPQVIPGSVSISSTGATSAETFGVADVILGAADVLPQGIDSQENIGAISLTTTITSPVEGNISEVAVGAVAVTSSNVVSLEGTDDGSRLGTASVSSSITVPQAATVSDPGTGSPQVTTSVSSLVNGVADGSAVGTVFVAAGGNTISPSGIPSTDGIGSPAATPGSVTILAESCSDGSDIGQPSASTGSIIISPTGVDAPASIAGAFAQPGMVTVNAESSSSSEATGSLDVLLSVTVSVDGIASSGLFGQSQIVRVVSCVGIDGGVTGAISATPGPVTISPVGIESSARIGNLLLQLAIAFVRVQAGDPVLLDFAQNVSTAWKADPELFWEVSL